MAVSVDGVFRIEDRASSSIDKIERAALRADAAIAKLGADLDKLEAKAGAARLQGAAGGADKLEASGKKASQSLEQLSQKAEAGSRTLAAHEARAKSHSRSLDEVGHAGKRGAEGVEKLSAATKKVDGGGFNALSGAMKLATGAADLLVGGIGKLGSMAGLAFPALIAGATALAPVLASLASVAAALPGLFSAFATAGITGMIALKGALSVAGLGFKALSDAQTNAFQNAQALAQQSHAVSDAQFAETTAAWGVAQAQQGVVSAYQAEYDAQRNLTQARIDALRNLQDLRAAAQDAMLGSTGAALQLERDRRALSQGVFVGANADLEQQQAALQVSRDVLDTQKAATTQQRAQQDLARASGYGISGNMQVIQATRAVTQSRLQMIEAQHGVIQANHAAADAAWSLQQAEAQLAHTQTFGSAANEAYLMALRQLSPAAQEFVKHLVAMRGTWQELQAVAGEQLFPHLDVALNRLKGFIPVIEPILRSAGGALGGAIDQAVKAVTSRPKQFSIIGQMDVGLIKTGGDAISHLIGALMNFMVAARPFTEWIARAFDTWAKNMERSSTHTNSIRAMLARAEAHLKMIWTFLKEVYDIFRALGRDMTPLADRLFGGMNGGLGNFLNVLNRNQGRITGFFNSLYDPLHNIGQALKAFSGLMGTLPVNPMKLLITLLNGAASVLRDITKIPGLGPILEGLLAVGVVAKIGGALHLGGAATNVARVGAAALGGAGLGSLKAIGAQRVWVVNWPKSFGGGGGGGGGNPLDGNRPHGRGAGRASRVGEAERLATEGEHVATEAGRASRLSRVLGWVGSHTGITRAAGALRSGGARLIGGAGRLLSGAARAIIPAGLAVNVSEAAHLAGGTLGRVGSTAARLGRGALNIAGKLPLVDIAAFLGAAALGHGNVGQRANQAFQALNPVNAITGTLGLIPGLHALGNLQTGGALSSALGGAAFGASIGAFGGPLAALAGGLLGGGVGALSSLFGGDDHHGPNNQRQVNEANRMLSGMQSGGGHANRATLMRWQHQYTDALMHQAFRGSPGAAAAAQSVLTNRGLALAAPALNSTARGLQTSTYKPSGDQLAGATIHDLANLPGQAQRIGGEAMVKLSAGMEAHHQLPKGTTQRLIRDLTNEYGPKFAQRLHMDGIATMAAYAKGMRAGGATLAADHVLHGIEQRFKEAHNRLIGTTQATINGVHQKWGWLVGETKVTTGNYSATVHAVMGKLEVLMKTSSGKQRADASAAYNKLKTETAQHFSMMFADTSAKQKALSGAIAAGSASAANVAGTNYNALVSNVTSAMQAGVLNTNTGVHAIGQALNDTLKALGATPIPLPSLKAVAMTVATGHAATQTGVNYQTGGNYGATAARGARVPGGVGPDNWRLIGPDGRAAALVGGGELLVTNRHTENRVNQMLAPYGTSLGAEVAGETTAHSAPGYAKGGWVQRAHPEVHGGVAAAAETVLDRFPGLQITSTYRPGGSSYHAMHEAIDVASGDYGLMNQAAGWIAGHIANQLTEGIHNPNLSVKNGAGVPAGFWGSATWQQHLNHIHLAVANAFDGRAAGGVSGAGGSGGGGVSYTPLKMPKVFGKGQPSDIVRRALRKVVDGGNKYLEKTAGGMGGGGGGTFNGTLNGSVAHQVFQYMSALGWSKSAIAGMLGNSVQESDMNPNAPGGGMWQQVSNFGQGTGGSLLNQMQHMEPQLRSIKAAMNSASPEDAARIMMEQWERPYVPTENLARRQAGARAAFAQGYSHGGRIPFGGWHAEGGDFNVSRPTMIGVGERGTERVSITPASRPSGGGGSAQHSVTVSIGHITNHEPGDIREIVLREFRGLAEDLDRVST